MDRKHLLIIPGTLLALAAMAMPPAGVGHRGSIYGVESSAEAFRAGAALGQEYLETDIKVTADGRFVLTHDDWTARLSGDSVYVPGATLDSLRSLPLCQTRAGRQYSGRFASLEEYLDICRQCGVKPLIELKWSRGINNSDFTNIPALMDAVGRAGFLDSCIIITSMRPCLQYIRENYPGVRLQWLCRDNWPEQIGWCQHYNIGVDIRRDCLDSAAMAEFRARGLEVNVWTVNDPDEYRRFARMGCDFITTDSLPPVHD